MKKCAAKRLKKRPCSKLIIFVGLLLTLICIALALFRCIQEKPEVTSESNLEEESDTQVVVINPNDFSAEPDDEQGAERKEECYTFLLVASDQVSGNADTIILVTYDVNEKFIGMVSIPRDTLINPEDGFSKYPKINSAYLRGIDNLKSAVSDLLGIPIDYYVTVDTMGFIKLVDAIGGIDFNVPIHMYYEDPVQDLYIYFEPGLQHLDGEDALKVCRLRMNSDGTIAYPDYDIGRTRTQQNVLLAVAKKMINQPQAIKEYVGILNAYVDTDLSLGNILWLLESVVKIDMESDVQTATLPGDGTVSFGNTKYCYQLFPEEVLQIVNDIANPYSESLRLDDLNICQVK